MTDADLSTPIEELPRLMARLDEGYDVAIASRALPGIERRGAPVARPARRSGRLFNLCVRVLAVPGLHDTQCGFKLFTAEAAEASFAPLQLDGFSFDVEALFVARRRGLPDRRGARHLAQRRGDAGRAHERPARLSRPRPDPRQRLAGYGTDGVVTDPAAAARSSFTHASIRASSSSASSRAFSSASSLVIAHLGPEPEVHVLQDRRLPARHAAQRVGVADARDAWRARPRRPPPPPR